MKFSSVRFGLARSLVALAVSLSLLSSAPVLAFASLTKTAAKANAASSTLGQPAASSPNELQLTSATATATAAGIELHWTTNSTPDNLGFNIYRLRAGQRTRVNKEIVPGALFAPGTPALMRAGYSYAWVDRSGTADATYFIESVNVQGSAKIHEPISAGSGGGQLPGAPNAGETEGADTFATGFPAAEASQPNSPHGTIEDQWALAAQTSLKIGVRKDGWYRVTQEQMVAAGFNPTVDIRNLRLFVDADEVAINTNQLIGTFGSGDYIEFYGRGLDTAVTDTRIYYLLAGTTPGKRVGGDIGLDDSPPGGNPPGPPGPSGPPATPPVVTPVTPPAMLIPRATAPASTTPVLRDPVFFSWFLRDFGSFTTSPSGSNAPVNPVPRDNDNSQSSTATYAPVQPDDYSASEPTAAAAGSKQSQTTAAVIKEPKSNAVSSAAPLVANTPAPKAAPPAAAPARAASARKFQKQSRSKKRKAGKLRRRSLQSRPERNHAVMVDGFVPASFDHTLQTKTRGVYLANLLNGDEENFFGQVISTAPAIQPFIVLNPDLTAPGPATVEFAVQGVMSQFGFSHQIVVSFNGVNIDTLDFGPLDHPVRSLPIPISQLHSGVNELKFTKTSTGESCIVDYVRLTYPKAFKADDRANGNIHLANQPNEDDALVVGGKTYAFKASATTDSQIGIGLTLAATANNIANRINADINTTLCTAAASATAVSTDVALITNLGVNGPISLVVDGLRLTRTPFATSLKFPLLGNLSLKIDGFSTPLMRVIDYTDPLNVSIVKPAAEPSAFGYAITVPKAEPFSKDQRLLYAIQQGQFLQPDTLVVSEPSTLNLTANAGAFLIIAYKPLIAAVEPLRAARAAQGFAAKTVDIEDIYDEFSYGVHGPQAIKDFLAYAAAHWSTPPRYVIFAGDASLDPRNYMNNPGGRFDYVPTKLVDATFNETCSDDWLTDFDNDGIADIPVGRLPFRTVADANLLIPRIVNFTPVTPQSAMLVADDPTGYYFNFEIANDEVQALLPVTMTVQRVNVRTVGPAAAKTNLIAGFNEGRALVNYSGHGNVDVWTSAAIFRASDALALTNGNVNKYSFVVVMDCLNGYFQDPSLLSLSEALLKAPNGGAVAAFASSGLTFPDGQHEMAEELYTLLYGPQPIALGDAIKSAKAATFDVDVRRTWIFFGDPSMKIR